MFISLFLLVSPGRTGLGFVVVPEVLLYHGDVLGDR